MSLVKTVLVLAALAAAVALIVRVMPREGGPPAPRSAEEGSRYRDAIAPPDKLQPAALWQRPAEPTQDASAPPESPPIKHTPPQKNFVLPPSEVLQPSEATTPTAQAKKDAEPTAAPGAPATVHRVGPGDSLYELARRYYGDPSRWTLIRDANPAIRGSGVKELRLGSELVIPAAPAASR